MGADHSQKALGDRILFLYSKVFSVYNKKEFLVLTLERMDHKWNVFGNALESPAAP